MCLAQRQVSLGLFRIATGDRIEPECFAQTQNLHVDLGSELGCVTAFRRHAAELAPEVDVQVLGPGGMLRLDEIAGSAPR